MAHRSAKKIVIVGGGISGLAAAHRVRELDPDAELTLVEASDRLGGVIRTVRQGEYLIEAGPDNFITNKPAGLALVERLGLTGELLQTNEANRRALVVRRGKLVPVPEGFLLMAPTKAWPIVRSPLLSPLGKLRMAWELRVPPPPDASDVDHDESLQSFVVRRFGREVFDRLVGPLVSGIYTADPATLSLRATLPRFLDMERTHGSLIRAMREQAATPGSKAAESGPRYSMFVSFKRGMGTLTDALAERIGAGRVLLNTRVTSLTPRGGGGWLLGLSHGKPLDADAVVIAGASYAAAKLVREFDDGLAGMLDDIEYASSVVVHLAWRRDQVPHALDGFGFVVPRIERRRILAGSFSSVKYTGRAPRYHVLMRAFLGGATDPGVLRKDDKQLVHVVREEFRDLLGVNAPPVLERVDRWERAMPQYKVGHVGRVAVIAERVATHPGLAVAGNAYHGVGIPDCIADAEAAVERLIGSA